MELAPGNQRVWAERLQQRGERDRGTEHEHKPGSWEEVEAIRARNGGSEGWTAAAGLPLHCTLDSTARSTQQLAAAVLEWLAAAGVLGVEAAPAGGGGDAPG